MENTTAENTTARYSYETKGNGFTVEIFAPDGHSIFFAQGEDASIVLEEIDKVRNMEYPAGPWADFLDAQDFLLSQYDMGDY